MPRGVYKRTAKHRLALSKGHIGVSNTWAKKGAESFSWKGDAVGYDALHRWVENVRGKPRECEHCGTTTAKRYEWANVSKKYRRRVNDWIRLCVSCHHKYDMTPERKAQAIKNLTWYKKKMINEAARAA